jgi:hypothetical protein
MDLKRWSLLRTVSVREAALRQKRPDTPSLTGSKSLVQPGGRQVYCRLAKGMMLLSALVVGLIWVPSLAAQSCVYCAGNGGCYPTSSGYFYCWPSGNSCQVSVPCAVAGGGCNGDSECLPRPVPLFLEGKTAPPAEGARLKAQEKKNPPKRVRNHHVAP